MKSSKAAVLRRCLSIITASILALVACHVGTSPDNGGASIRVISGGNAADTPSVVLAEPLVVEVRGPDGLPAAGAEVTFIAGPDTTQPYLAYIAATPLSGFRGVVHSTADQSGRASVRVLFASKAGPAQVMARAPALGVETATTFTIRPGQVAGASVKPQDRPVYVDGTYQLTATLVDRSGNPIPSTPTFATSSSSIQVSSTGAVRGKAFGRGRIDVHVGSFTDSAFTSVVPRGVLAVFVIGRLVGDTMGYAQVSLDGSGFRWIGRTGFVPYEFAPDNPPSRWVHGTNQLVYTRLVDESPRVFVGDSTEAAYRVVAQPPPTTFELEPEVSPDGRWIYYYGNDPLGTQALWRVPTGGGIPERLTTTADGYEFRSPSVSPDGTRLAYVARAAGWQSFQAYVRDLTTGATRLLSPNKAAGLRWSPTGEWILYAVSESYAGFSGPLRIVHPDGTGDRALIDGAYFPGGTWSPDGKYVIGVWGEGIKWGMELIDVAAGSRLPLGYPVWWYGPSWRP